MVKFKIYIVLFVVLTTFIFMSCQDSPTSFEPVLSSDTGKLSKIIIPAGATIDSSYFFINATTAFDKEVALHRITADWEELVVTWNNFGNSFDAAVEGSFMPETPGWYFADITALVTGWFDGINPNYGLLLKETAPDTLQTYSSRESGTSPYIIIWYTLNGISIYDSTDAFADTYIRSDLGDNNFGSETELNTGWQDTVENKALIRFEIEKTSGCTRSSGYWKTHSAYGPAPYDPTWALLGEDSTFFLSGKSYYQVFWTPPAGGNAYYILSHAYIATELNFLNGADPQDAQNAFDDATDLFNTYTPEHIGGLKGNDSLRQEFLGLKDILEQYNNGITGPGKCGSSETAAITIK
jgi:hypothetical protein